jgi:hypothetical protein
MVLLLIIVIIAICAIIFGASQTIDGLTILWNEFKDFVVTIIREVKA